MILALLACTGSQPQQPPESADRGLVPLEDGRLLRRMSLDLRGRLPSVEELERVEQDPAQLELLRDEMLEDAAFEERLRHLLAEQWLTRADRFNIGTWELGLDASRRHELAWSVGSEPVVLMAWVAANDLPWSETVTADYTLANELLLELYPLEPLDQEPSAEQPWVRARYSDGRPPAGVVSTNGLWWRYFSAPNNYNRSRAAAVSRLLLCEDYLTRPVQFSAEGLADLDPELEATKEVPSCRSCHATLDPLAAGFFGYWVYDLYDPIEAVAYHPERELLGPSFLDMEMGWFGTPVSSPAELFAQIPHDPRFASCAVERAARSMWRREPGLEDFQTLDRLRADFEDEGLLMKQLLADLTDTPDYQVGALTEDALEDEQRQATHRVMSPELLATSVEQVTGLRWEMEGFDPFRDDIEGYRILAGGLDGHAVTEPLHSPSLSQGLVLKRLSQAAGQHMVEQGQLSLVGPEDAVWAEQVTRLSLQLHAQEPSAEDLVALEELWLAVEASSDAQQAWASLVSVLLRDDRFWSY